MSGLEIPPAGPMLNETGQGISERALVPVDIGLSGTPKAGDEVITVADERKARESARLKARPAKSRPGKAPIDIEDISKQFEAGANQHS